MKGSLHTDELMREVTSSKTGLRTARRISHVFIMDVPTYSETLFITDAAINIFPDLDAKRDIVQNAIDLFTQVGLGTPRVAILSAVETVTSKIPSTIDAAALCKMADRGQITGGILDGPLAFDNAIDPEAARIKGIKSAVAGRAQILVVPDLEAGNMLAKNLIFLAKADAAGIVLGARVPIILTSRAIPCARAWPPARSRCSTPHARRAQGGVAGGVTVRWIRSSSSTPAPRASSFRSSGSSGRAASTRLIKGQMDGIGARPRLRADGGRRDAADRPRPMRRSAVPDVADRARDRRELGCAKTQKLRADRRRASRRAWRPDYDRPVLVDEEVLDAARALCFAGAAAPAEQPGADPLASRALARTCRRSPASTPPSIAATARLPTTTRFRSASTRRACAATAFTACRTNTSPTACRRWRPRSRPGA